MSMLANDVPPDDPPQHPPYELADPLADVDRPATAVPSQQMLEHELPGGREARDPYAALRVPAFRKFAAAFFLSSVGAQVQTAAVGWEIYLKTDSTKSLGYIGLAMAIPMLVLSLPAGQLADTFSRKKLFLFMQVAMSVCALGLTVSSGWFGTSPHWTAMIYGLLVVSAIGGTIGRPGREALMVQTVPAAIYPNAVTWNATGFETSSMGGPALGGMIIWLAGPATAYAVAAACFVTAFGLILLLPDTRVEPARFADGSPRPAAGLADLAAGIRFVFNSRLILAALSLDLFAVLFGGATFLLPVFARDVLHVGAFGFGCLRAAPSIGAVTMAMVQAHRPPFKRAGRALLFAVAGFGLATVVFGLSRNYALSFVMLIFTGVFDNVSVVIRHSLVPLLTPDSMRGRVLAVNQIFVGSSNELGGLESGLTADWFGVVGSVVGGGIASIAVVLAVAAGFSEVRKLGSIEDVRPITDDSNENRPGSVAAV